jgi:hypothetical protein
MSNNRAANNAWYEILRCSKHTPENLELQRLANLIRSDRCFPFITPGVWFYNLYSYYKTVRETEIGFLDTTERVNLKHKALIHMYYILQRMKEI